MRQITVIISLIASVAFLGLSVLTAYQVFILAISDEETVRGELWILLVLCFIGGAIMIGIAWGITELSEARHENAMALQMEEIEAE